MPPETLLTSSYLIIGSTASSRVASAEQETGKLGSETSCVGSRRLGRRTGVTPQGLLKGHALYGDLLKSWARKGSWIADNILPETKTFGAVPLPDLLGGAALAVNNECDMAHNHRDTSITPRTPRDTGFT